MGSRCHRYGSAGRSSHPFTDALTNRLPKPHSDPTHRMTEPATFFESRFLSADMKKGWFIDGHPQNDNPWLSARRFVPVSDAHLAVGECPRPAAGPAARSLEPNRDHLRRSVRLERESGPEFRVAVRRRQ